MYWRNRDFKRCVDTSQHNSFIYGVIRKCILKSNETIESYSHIVSKESSSDDERSKAQEIINAEKVEREILSSYLPKQISDEELREIVESKWSTLAESVPHGKKIKSIIDTVVSKVGKDRAENSRIVSMINSINNKSG